MASPVGPEIKTSRALDAGVVLKSFAIGVDSSDGLDHTYTIFEFPAWETSEADAIGPVKIFTVGAHSLANSITVHVVVPSALHTQ